MLPADLAGSAAAKLPLWRDYVLSGEDPAIRSILVSISTNILVNVLTALAAFRLLGLFGFSVGESVAGVLSLLCATTHLHYAQNMAENNYILLLTITGFALQYKWLTTGDRRALFWGSAALGLNLLTRVTTAMDLFGAGCFILLAVSSPVVAAYAHVNRLPEPALDAVSKQPILLTVREYLRGSLPVYAVFLVIDRIYQYIRFGSWTNTYVAIFAREQRMMDPTLPTNFPFNRGWFEGGFHSGVLGPFFMPEKSIFLFDPMFPLALLLTALLWKRLSPAMRAFAVASLAMLAAYVLFYARYNWWAGDFAWGDRYISSAVELTTLLAIPLLLRYRQALGRTIWYLALSITGISVAIQCASLAFWLPLEIYQMETLGHPTCVVLLRFKNIAAFRAAQTGGLGAEYAGHVSGLVGRDAHHYVELSAFAVAPCRSGATVGGACALRRVGRGGSRALLRLSKAGPRPDASGTGERCGRRVTFSSGCCNGAKLRPDAERWVSKRTSGRFRCRGLSPIAAGFLCKCVGRAVTSPHPVTLTECWRLLVSRKGDGTGGSLRLICEGVAIRKRGRQRNPDGHTLRRHNLRNSTRKVLRDE